MIDRARRGGPGRVRRPGRHRSPAVLAALLVLLVPVACDGPPGDEDRGSGAPDQTSAASATAGARERAPAGGEQRPADSRRLEVSELGINAGAPDAPVQVVEFSDFGCPHCREFHEEVYPTLHEEYVETGKVIWKYVPFVLGVFPNSVEAARAGECAIEQDAFAPMRTRLFATQETWKSSDEPARFFVRLARQEGLDADRFRRCVEERWREERLLRTLEVAEDVGLDRTPTFFVQERRLEGARSAAFFRDLFDRLLEDRGRAGERDTS